MNQSQIYRVHQRRRASHLKRRIKVSHPEEINLQIQFQRIGKYHRNIPLKDKALRKKLWRKTWKLVSKVNILIRIKRKSLLDEPEQFLIINNSY